MNELSSNQEIKMPATKRLKSYDAAFKLKVTAYAEEHGNRAAGREFCINESMVRSWRKQKDERKKAILERGDWLLDNLDSL